MTAKPVASPAHTGLAALISTPFADGTCGEDPRYSDRFAQAKDELEKLSGTDFARVLTLAGEVLSQESKDLRALGYLALAAAYERGLGGLTEVCLGYTHVLREWWDGCHPQRENARRAAIKWLNNPRFAAFLSRAPDASDQAAVEALAAAVKALNEVVAERLADEPPQWKELTDWLRAQGRAQQTTASSKSGGGNADSGGAGAGRRIAKVNSDQTLNSASREILGYLRQQGDWGRLVAFARALRWGSLLMPPNEDGTTRIPAPRQAALAEVEAAMERNAWQDAFLACEAAYLEPGGQFCFQLQQWGEMAAERMGQPQLAQLIADQTRGLLNRLPGLVELRYENGAPFVATSCIEWIEALTRQDAGGVAGGDVDKEWQKCEQQAREAAAEKGLAAGLAVLDGYRIGSRRVWAQVQLAKAQLCLAQARGDLALPVLEALSEQLDAESVIGWAPEFALQVWRTEQKAVRGAGKQAGLSEAEIKARLAHIKARICRTDLAAAVAQF